MVVSVVHCGFVFVCYTIIDLVINLYIVCALNLIMF